MLIEFSVSNYRSIRDTQTLSLVAGTGTELGEQNSFNPPASSAPKLLRSAVIFGPNAGGKSNIIKAMHFMQKFVISSSSRGQEGEKISTSPFRLDKKSPSQPSTFEVIFIEGGVRYQYGMAVTQSRVEREWLLAYPEGRAQRWFERTFVSNTNNYEWYFGPFFKGQKEILKKATRVNALFLSTGVQLNNEQLRDVFNWFDDRLVTIHASEKIPEAFAGYTLHRCENESDRQQIVRFLQAADLGIDDLKVKKGVFAPNDFLDEMPDKLKQKFLGKEFSQPVFFHEHMDSTDISGFEFEDESDGTQGMFALAGPWIDTLETGKVLVVDELDTSLHPMLMRFLIETLHSSESNPNNAQLVFTTHDATLMASQYFRRDQIWFVEKDKSRSTTLYPLSDFSPRKGEAIEKGYLRGRYGALPFTERFAA